MVPENKQTSTTMQDLDPFFMPVDSWEKLLKMTIK